ncbi:MAG: GNAT family N-acetyltransferase [Hyphomicrobiales bacterium]
MTPDHMRVIALALPEAVESAHMGHPDFRVRGKIFATLSAERALAMAKLTREQQEMLCAAEPAIFAPVPGGWGQRGSTHIRLAAVDETTLASALLMAWRNVAPKRLVAEQGERAKMNAAGPTASRKGKRAPAPERSRLVIRPARQDEAEAISRMIVRTLRQSNSRDYEPAAIETMALDFSPSEVAPLMRERLVFVAFIGAELVGTVSLSTGRVNSVFVDPSHQGRGIGARMMAFIEKLALQQGRESVSLTSSLTAVSFYRKLGYEGEERQLRHGVSTVLVTKPLKP